MTEGEQYEGLVKTYGKCNIALPEKGILQLLFEGILTPFYLFQLFSVILWFIDDYTIYAVCIVVTSLVSIATELIDVKRNLRNLKKMVDYECNMTVRRLNADGQVVVYDIPSNDLVPGDIIHVPEGLKMPCDAVLLTGSSILNEAMLTGESIPVIKNPLPNVSHQSYDPDEDKNHTLFSGTEVIQNRKLGSNEVTAMVIRTSFNTLKGSLIKSILYPKPNRFSFHADSMKFICCLAIIAVCGFAVTLPTSIRELPARKVVIKALDLICITVPPALPAVMSIGIVFALNRLKKDKIYCISSQRINVAGRVKTIVFDKTGTLTEDSLKFAGVTVASHEGFHNKIEDLFELSTPSTRKSEALPADNLKKK